MPNNDPLGGNNPATDLAVSLINYQPMRDKYNSRDWGAFIRRLSLAGNTNDDIKIILENLHEDDREIIAASLLNKRRKGFQ